MNEMREINLNPQNNRNIQGQMGRGAEVGKPEFKKEMSYFTKLIIISVFFIGLSLYFGFASKFLFSSPFFFISPLKDNLLNIEQFALSLLLFLVAASVLFMATHDSLVEFLPALLLGTVAYLVGVGDYGLPGVIMAIGFTVSVLIYFLFVQADTENSFTFSVRHSLASVSVFLTVLFAVISAGYYFSTAELLTADELLPDEVADPAYEVQVNLLAKQFGVEPDKVDDEIRKIEDEGGHIESLGIFELEEGSLDSMTMYEWFREEASKTIAPFVRWLAAGLAITLFLSLTIFITPLNYLVKGLTWLVCEGLVVVKVFKKRKEMKEAELLSL